jgi:hypothetical protein
MVTLKAGPGDQALSCHRRAAVAGTVRVRARGPPAAAAAVRLPLGWPGFAGAGPGTGIQSEAQAAGRSEYGASRDH